LHLDLLASYNDRALAHSALFHLPESLVEAYAEIMKRVLSNYPNARRFLYWILYALRPLTVAELKVATTQNEEVGGANTDLGSFETQILNQTVGLTAIDAITGTVNLVHSTAIDSLHRMASASVIFSSAQKEISETCLTLLSADEVVDDCYASKCDIHRSSTDTLVSYAAAYWGYHARDAAEEEQTIQVLITTFLNKLSWRRPFTMDYGLATEHDFPEELGIGKYPEYWNPLHVLAYFGIICRAKRLLEQGVDIDTHANRLGVTPLLCAAYRGNEEMIELLLDHGANINAQTESGDTALHLAAIKGRRKTIKVLLARGIDTRIVNKAGASALQRTVGTLYDEATIPLLIRGKSDVNARNTMTGDTSLHLAVAFRRPRILLFLLDKNANINAFNDDRLTPLQLAAQLNNCEALILLLERGANVDARAQGDVTALHVSAEADNWVAFDLLLAGGADINAWDRVGNTLLHKQAAEPLGVGIASKLLDQGANLEARNSKGNTPLQSAALAGNKTMFLFLLERGANVAVETPKGENMLHITPPRDEHFLGIHQILLEKGLSVAATSSQGWTPLQQTCLQGTGSSDTTLDKSCEYLELLLSHGANINAMAESGEMESALHLATRAPVPRPSYVSLLLRHGADVNAKTKEGKTPLHLAAERGRESIFRILLEHGTDSLIKAPCSELKAGSSHAMGKSSGMTAFDLAKKNPLGALWFDDEGTLWPPATLSRRGSIATTIDDMSEIEDEVDQSETETGESTLVGE
jgi:ankyrin repeat protein